MISHSREKSIPSYMEFGRVSDLETIDFTLPSSHPANTKILSGVPSVAPTIYVGCPVWHDKGWNGILFPKGTKDIQHLHFYAKKFNSIELNSTHYHVPTESTVLRWKNETPPGFKFFTKIPQSISHLENLKYGIIPLLQFIDRMHLLDDRLGTFFLQLPPTSNTQKRKGLEELLSAIPEEISVAIELRHEDWFSNVSELDAMSNFLYLRKSGLVITDVAGRRDVLHQRVLNKKIMVRFTANNLHPTDFSRMDDWVKLIREWLSLGLEELQFFVHTPNKALCLDLALYFLKKMELPYHHLEIKNIQGTLF